MLKNIMIISTLLLVPLFAGAKDKIFQPASASPPVIQRHVAFLYHPQMIDSRNGAHYDISARSNLHGTCLAFGFDHGAVGADLFKYQAVEAVVIDTHGIVIGIDHGIQTIQTLKCSAY